MLSQAGMYSKKKEEKASASTRKGEKFDLVFTYGYVQFSESDKKAIEAIPDLAEELQKFEKQEKSMLEAFSLGNKSIDRLRNRQAPLSSLLTLCDMRAKEVTTAMHAHTKELEKEAAFNSWDQRLGRNKLVTQSFIKIEITGADGNPHVFNDFENARQFIEGGCQTQKVARKRAKR